MSLKCQGIFFAIGRLNIRAVNNTVSEGELITLVRWLRLDNFMNILLVFSLSLLRKKWKMVTKHTQFASSCYHGYTQAIG